MTVDLSDLERDRTEIPYRWDTSCRAADVVYDFADLPPDTLTPLTCATAGRVVLRRGQGAISFADMSDSSGTVQLVLQADRTAGYDQWMQHVTLGHWVGIRGTIGTTKRGQPSVFVDDWQLLARFEGSWPGKSGIADPELRVRQRILHLMSDVPSSADFYERVKARIA